MHRCNRQDVGGASNFQVLWGYYNLKYQPVFSKLKRIIVDFIDYSLPPISRPDPPKDKYLTHIQLLSVEYKSALVSYPSPD